MANANADDRRDLAAGIPIGELQDDAMVAGRVGEEDVLVVAHGTDLFAIGAKCTHYHGPLVDGLVVGDTIRCPWHHACFSLRTGEALKAPALDPVSCWRVERADGCIFVRERFDHTPQRRLADRRSSWPNSVAIVGGGGAGLAAASMLRREGYDRPIAIFSGEARPPVDRPNLSKDYLSGQAKADWMPLTPSTVRLFQKYRPFK